MSLFDDKKEKKFSKEELLELEFISQIKEEDFGDYTNELKEFNKIKEKILNVDIHGKVIEYYPVVFWFENEEEAELIKAYFNLAFKGTPKELPVSILRRVLKDAKAYNSNTNV